jgi:hypothetical protein
VPDGRKEWPLSHTTASTTPMQPSANSTEPTPRVNPFASHCFPHLVATTLSTESKTLAASSTGSSLPATDVEARAHDQPTMITVAGQDVVVVEIAGPIPHEVLPTTSIGIHQVRTVDEVTAAVVDDAQASGVRENPAPTTEATSLLVDDLERHKKNSTLRWKTIGEAMLAGMSRMAGLRLVILLRLRIMPTTAWTWLSRGCEKDHGVYCCCMSFTSKVSSANLTKMEVKGTKSDILKGE